MNKTDLTQYNQDSRPLHPIQSRLEDSLFSKDLAPHYMKLAGQLSSSELVPKCFRGKPQDLFLCWSIGYSIGMSPEQSMQCIAIINGRACMWGDEMLGLVMAHQDFQDIIEEPLLDNNVTIGYKCTVKRKGRSDKTNIFTLDMAKKAGLLAKGGPWIQYTERMLKLRARGFTLRDAFPDALKGIKSREEVQDYIDGEYSEVTPVGTTRTEQLKNDFLHKKGVLNATPTNGFSETVENSEIREENTDDTNTSAMDASGREAAKLHIKIAQLIADQGLSGEKISHNLRFYEVDSIDQLSLDSANHFYSRLTDSL